MHCTKTLKKLEVDIIIVHLKPENSETATLLFAAGTLAKE